MSMLLILVPLSLLLVVVAVWAFMWAVGSGQFDDLETPAWDILTENEPVTAVMTNDVTNDVSSGVTTVARNVAIACDATSHIQVPVTPLVQPEAVAPLIEQP